jgi:hypothetical protein
LRLERDDFSLRLCREVQEALIYVHAGFRLVDQSERMTDALSEFFSDLRFEKHGLVRTPKEAGLLEWSPCPSPLTVSAIAAFLAGANPRRIRW